MYNKEIYDERLDILAKERAFLMKKEKPSIEKRMALTIATNIAMTMKNCMFDETSTKNIIEMAGDLLAGYPISPIEDCEEETWKMYLNSDEDGVELLENGRYPYLIMKRNTFHHDKQEPKVSYHDTKPIVAKNIWGGNKTDEEAPQFVNRILEEMFPISLPYMPKEHIWSVYIDRGTLKDIEFLGILLARKSGDQNIYKINRYFCKKDEEEFEEVSDEEFYKRQNKIMGEVLI